MAGRAEAGDGSGVKHDCKAAPQERPSRDRDSVAVSLLLGPNMLNAIESGLRKASGDWSARLRRGSVGVVAILAVAVPAAMRSTPAAAAPQRDVIATPLEAVPNAVATPLAPGVDALRRGEIDLVATYRTAAEDPCLVLRREASHQGGESTSIAMLVRLKRLDQWVIYFPVAGVAEAPPSFHDPGARMRWRASRDVRAIALGPDSKRVVESAVAAWYAHCPVASEGSVMKASLPTEEVRQARRFAARRNVR